MRNPIRKICIAFTIFFLFICISPVYAYADESGYSNGDLMQEIYNFEDAVLNQDNGNAASKDDVKDVKDYVAEVKASMSSETEKGVQSYFDAKKTESNKGAEAVFSISDMLIDTANQQWKMVSSAMKSVGITNEWGFSLNVSDYGESGTNHYIFDIFRTFAYSLVLVFFSANLIESSIKYEIFTLRGGANIFGRLLLSKVIIDKSGQICLAILNAIGGIATQILTKADATVELHIPDFKSSLVKSDIWIVGTLVDSISALVIAIPVAIVALIALIAACLVTIKLILRSIELCMMVAVSPTFFACFSSDVSRPYFRNFIVTFIQVAIEILFMAVVYAVCASWITTPFGGDTTNVVKWFMSFLPNALILLTMAILMVKPPKVLTGLLH